MSPLAAGSAPPTTSLAKNVNRSSPHVTRQAPRRGLREGSGSAITKRNLLAIRKQIITLRARIGPRVRPYRGHAISYLVKYQSSRPDQSIPVNNKLAINA